MTSIGAEVGQKMRSAIKAKLLELNCYVDDELPDYVMVMVANKRTKSQMKEDLQLFLSNKTATFVDWLHIVLKKLKEVTVTNPEVYKKTVKRKLEEASDQNIKKEKKEKKVDKKIKKEPFEKNIDHQESNFTSLTDDLPINANRLSEQRKIIIMKEHQSNSASEQVMQDNFDIPLLSEVNISTEEELEDIEKKIKSVKSRLGLLVESDEEDYMRLKPEPDELLPPVLESSNDQLQVNTARKEKLPSPPKRTERTKITFEKEEDTNSNTKRKSVLERLGKRRSHENENTSPTKKNRIDLLDFRKEQDKRETRDKRFRNKNDGKPKESVLQRLGVMSKVSIPLKTPEEPEEPIKNREVPSMIKIKPRIIPPDAPQPNKNLLLKAVAEAQKSIAQAPPVGQNSKPEGLFTRKYKETHKEESTSKKLPEVEKNKIKKILAAVPNEKDKSLEYVPTPIDLIPEPIPKYIPSSKTSDAEPSLENGKMKQQFIVTLDGLEKTKYKDLLNEETKISIKSRLDKKKSPSPIVFDEVTTSTTNKPQIPDKLPFVHAPPSVKNKERCKYWPSCRQGDKCEFVHPTANCEKFPHCKFGDKCLYLHPACKFGNSCTRRDCVYSHSPNAKLTGTRTSTSTPTSLQICKYFPNCTNLSCSFYHPKPCKFGKYCKNQAECSFLHNSFVPTKSSMTWRSK